MLPVVAGLIVAEIESVVAVLLLDKLELKLSLL